VTENAVGHLANLARSFGDDPAGAVVGSARASGNIDGLLIDDVDVIPCIDFGDDDVLGDFVDLRQACKA